MVHLTEGGYQLMLCGVGHKLVMYHNQCHVQNLSKSSKTSISSQP